MLSKNPLLKERKINLQMYFAVNAKDMIHIQCEKKSNRNLECSLSKIKRHNTTEKTTNVLTFSLREQQRYV